MQHRRCGSAGKGKTSDGVVPSEVQRVDWSVDLYRLEYFAEIFIVTLGMPILTFKVYGLTKFEIDIFNVLIAQCALLHSCYHLAFR